MDREENARNDAAKRRLMALQDAAKSTLQDSFVSGEQRMLNNQKDIERIQARERAEFDKEKAKQVTS
jgi:hypothetical protein